MMGEVAASCSSAAGAATYAVVAVSVHPGWAAANAVVTVDTERTAAVSVVVSAAARNVGAVSVFAVPHEWLVVSEGLGRVVEFPAVSAEVLEAGDIATEVGALLEAAGGAERVLEVGVDLNLLGELCSLDLDESGGDGAHVSAAVVEGHAPGSHGVLEFVRVHTCVDNSAEEVVEDVGERLGGEHPVEGTDEHRPPRIELLRGAAHKVGVGDDPGDDLHLLVAHPAAGDLEVPAAAPAVVVGAVVQEVLDLFVVFEDDVEIPLGDGG